MYARFVRRLRGKDRREPVNTGCQVAFGGPVCGSQNYRTYLIKEKFVQDNVVHMKACDECSEYLVFLRIVHKYPLDPE